MPTADSQTRCPWSEHSPLEQAYHDTEWGYPVADDRRLFEKICLEGFQSGLSWRTVLAKRPAFRAAFAGFEMATVAGFDNADIARLLADVGIIRHRGKIEATINNACCAMEIVAEYGSLASYIWSFDPAADQTASVQGRTTSPESAALSRELKRRGWKFVGPTTMYAFMQAMGLVNDHLPECVIRPKVEAARAVFEVPQPVTQRGQRS